MWRSDVFSSVEDKLIVKIKGFCKSGCISLYGIKKSGDEKILFCEDVSGDFNISFSIDPASLGVYEEIVEYYASVSSECRIDEWNVSAPDVSHAPPFLARTVTCNGGKLDLKNIKKALFVGNSILVGMFSTYGMCATDEKNDYSYHVCQEILKHSPNCSFGKLYSSPFEHSESTKGYEDWFYYTPNDTTKKPACESFEKDLDLVFLQMMDNVNTPAKTEAFKKNVPLLLEEIKKRSPKAKIVWVYGWFLKPELVGFIETVSKEWEIATVNVSSAHTMKNRSYSGQISITPDGHEIVVDNLWISHPGNSGMRAIADLIIDCIF